MISMGMIGKGSRDKTFLMMYLGKLLSQGLDVQIVTGDQWLMPEVSSYEYNQRMTIAPFMKENTERDIIIVDITEPESMAVDVTVYVSDIDRTSVEANEVLFRRGEASEDDLFLFTHMIFDSKINEKYLCNRFGIDRRKNRVLTLYLDDGDMAVNLENGYNDRLDIRGLSKAYKKLLLTLGAYSGTEPRTLKRWLRMAERSK